MCAHSTVTAITLVMQTIDEWSSMDENIWDFPQHSCSF